MFLSWMCEISVFSWVISCVSCVSMLSGSMEQLAPIGPEGIETQEQFNLLQRYGCDFGQGYLFSRPVPITELNGAMSTVI